jgi:DNA-binding CsgD family transcriptional regulator
MTHPNPVPIDLDLIEQIYDVALGRASWKEVLAALKVEFSTEASLLAVYEDDPKQARGLAISDPDGRRWDEYAQHYAAIDPFAAAIRSGRVPAGVVVPDEVLVPTRRFCASEYFNDWFRPNGMRHTVRGYVPIHDRLVLQLGMPRALRAGPYSADELARLQRYFNLIGRAVQVQEALGSRSVAPDYDGIARAYALTAAEVRLIEGLAQSGSLRRAAQHVHRSYYTLRAHLRSVFLKTGTHTQAELIRLIHQGRDGSREERTRRPAGSLVRVDTHPRRTDD